MAHLYLLMVVWVVLQVLWPANPSASAYYAGPKIDEHGRVGMHMHGVWGFPRKRMFAYMMDVWNSSLKTFQAEYVVKNVVCRSKFPWEVQIDSSNCGEGEEGGLLCLHCETVAQFDYKEICLACSMERTDS
jgi:hypothetical protein